MGPGYEYWEQFLLESPIPEYKILGENFIVAPTWNDYFDNGKGEAFNKKKNSKKSDIFFLK